MDMTRRETGTEQRSDNTYVRKPEIKEKVPFNFGTVFQDKDGDWLSSTQGRVYKDKYGKIYTAKQYEDYIKNGTDEISRFDGMPLVRGLGGDPVSELIVENAILNKPLRYVGGKVFNALRQTLVPSNRAAHVYVNVSPASYYGHTAEIKGAVKDMLKGRKADVSKPKWEIKDAVGNYMPQYDDVTAGNIGSAFRNAAWKKYLGLSDGSPYYVKNKNGTWSYNLDEIEKLTKDGIKFGEDQSQITGTSMVSSDFLTSAGGNLSLKVDRLTNHNLGNNETIKQYVFKDRWDLHPFSRDNGTISKRVGRSMGLLKDYESVNEAIGNFVRNQLGNYIKPLKNFQDPKLKTIEKIDKFGRNFEIGKVLGGKPFDMETKVYTKEVINRSKNQYPGLPPFTIEDEPIRDMTITNYLDRYAKPLWE